MTKRQQIILAVAEGCRNTRQVAERLGWPHSTVRYYFLTSDERFVNGRILRWEPGKHNTLRLAPKLGLEATVYRRPTGRGLWVGRVEWVVRNLPSLPDYDII